MGSKPPTIRCEARRRDGQRCSCGSAWLFRDDENHAYRLCGSHANLKVREGMQLRKVAFPDGSPLPAGWVEEGKDGVLCTFPSTKR
jgi:hypothetical protein